MYYKITKIGDEKYSSMGMVEIMVAFYLEEGDDGYDKYIAEHLVTIPVIPEKGYEGKVDEMGSPVDQDDYNNWIKFLPTIQQLNPFCNHSIQFEADQLPTDENGLTEEAQNNIDYCFQWALGITAKNYLLDDLGCQKGRKDESGNFLPEIDYSVGGQVVNQDINYLSRKAFYEGVSIIPVENQTDLMKTELAKISSAESVALSAKSTDLSVIPMKIPSVLKVK